MSVSPNNMDRSTIENLFRSDPDQVVKLYQSLPDPSSYPDIAYYTGNRLAMLGQDSEAREAYLQAEKGYGQDVFGQNRVRLGWAHLMFRAGQYDLCAELALRVLDSSDDDIHRMAAHLNLGYVHQSRGDFEQANQHYQDAVAYANKARCSPDLSFERRSIVVQDQFVAVQHLAELYLSHGMYDLAMVYQRQAGNLAKIVEAKMPQYALYSYCKLASLHEQRGELQEALDLADQTVQKAQEQGNQHLAAQANILQIRVLGKMGHDSRAREALSDLEVKSLAHEDSIELLLAKARQWLYMNELEKARHLIRELQAIRTENQNLQFEITLLKTAFACMQGHGVDNSSQVALEEAIRIRDQQHNLVGASEIKLILAWALACENQMEAAREWLQACARDCQSLGHISHIWRWYMLSLKTLGHLWLLVEGDFQEQAETYARLAPSTDIGQVRFYAFGIPELWIHGENQLKQIREGTKHAPMLILFAEHSELPLSEITEIIWGEGDNPRASFHQLRHKNPEVSKLILHDSQRLVYSLDQEAFSYVDLWHFRELAEQARLEPDPALRILYYRVALRLSAEPLARGVEHPYLEGKRDEYRFLRAQFIRTVRNLQETLREEMARQPIPHMWRLELHEAEARFGRIDGLS